MPVTMPHFATNALEHAATVTYNQRFIVLSFYLMKMNKALIHWLVPSVSSPNNTTLFELLKRARLN
jgi:hypothetical protein